MASKYCLPGLVFITAFFFCHGKLSAQTTNETREEVWPELDIYYKLNPQTRLFAFYSATKLKSSSFTDGGAGLAVDYFAFPHPWEIFKPDIKDTTAGYFLWFRGGYKYSASAPESNDPFKEHTLNAEVNPRLYLPFDIKLINRNRFDFRIAEDELKTRYRPRITLEKPMSTIYLYYTPYIYVEYFVNFNDASLNRFRLAFGAEIKIARNLNFDFYFLHQFANGEAVEKLNASGITFKFYFGRKFLRTKISERKQIKESTREKPKEEKK